MTPEERLNQAESTAKKALEEVAEARVVSGYQELRACYFKGGR